MGFREDLEAIRGRVDGAFAASLMGFDGIAIETTQAGAPAGIEVQNVIVEYEFGRLGPRPAVLVVRRAYFRESGIATAKRGLLSCFVEESR